MAFKPFAVTAEKVSARNVLNDQPIYIYYFYFTPRCDECIILEKALLKVLNGHYAQELKSKRLILKMINLTNPDPESKKIIQELRVRRQLLLLVSGETKVNLTKDAFRYAENQYERFRDIIKAAIDQALSQ
jgi:predicted DsbA family dithiol-disulfide isomerase